MSAGLLAVALSACGGNATAPETPNPGTPSMGASADSSSEQTTTTSSSLAPTAAPAGDDLLLRLADAGVECGDTSPEDVSAGEFAASGFSCIGPTAAVYLLVARTEADISWVRGSMCHKAVGQGDTDTIAHGDNWVAVALTDSQRDLDAAKVAEILGGTASPTGEYCTTDGGRFADSVISRLADAGIDCAMDSADNSLLDEGLFAREILCFGKDFVVLVAVADSDDQFDPLKEKFCANLLAADATNAITEIAFGEPWVAAAQSNGAPISADRLATTLDGKSETLDRFCA